MPVDLRKVIFSNEEVQAALVNYCLRHDIKMPDTHITSIDVHWEPELTTDMHFEPQENNGDGKELSFSNEQLAAALILYCQVKGDPLPRESQKTLEPVADGVSLTTRHAWGDSPTKDHPGLAIPWMEKRPAGSAKPEAEKDNEG